MFSGKRLKALREERGYSQAETARQLGISRISYFNWEVEKTQPNQTNLDKLSQVFGVEPEFFQAYYDLTHIYRQLNNQNQTRSLAYTQGLLRQQIIEEETTPRYAYRVYEKLSAGPGTAYFDDGNFDVVYFDQELDHDFASWIYGDSMEPTYLSGEVALIKQTGFDYDGAIYAIDWDGQTYIKKVYREAEGLRLVSLNNKYQDRFAPYGENPRIIGKIVGHFPPMGE